MHGLRATWRVATRSARARIGRIFATLVGAALSAAFAAAGFGVAASFDTLVTGSDTSNDLSLGLPEGSVVISAATGGTTEPTSITEDLVDQASSVDEALSAQGTYDQPLGIDVPSGSQDIRPPILKNLIFTSAYDPARWEIIDGRSPESVEASGGSESDRFIEVALDAGGMAAAATSIGQVVELETPTGEAYGLVTGLAAPVGAEATQRFTSSTTGIDDVRLVANNDDLPWLLGADGRVDRINVVPRDGVSPEALIEALQVNLPDGLDYVVATDRAANQAKVVSTITNGISAGTWAFAIVSSLVAAVLVANTFSILVAQRVREIGVARTIGMSRPQVIATVLVEAATVGIAAAGIGMLLSIPLSVQGAEMINEGVSIEPTLTGDMIVTAIAVGFGVTVFAALLPAIRASRTSPLDGIRSATSTRNRKNLGWLLTAPLLWMLKPIFSPFRNLRLALASAKRDARRSGATASTLSIAFGLVAIVLTASTSIRSTVDDQFVGSSNADLYLQRRGLVRTDAPTLEATLDIPIEIGFSTVSSVEGSLRFGDNSISDVSATRAETLQSVIDIGLDEGNPLTGPGASVMLSIQGAEDLGASVGDSVVLRSSSGTEKSLEVVGTYSKAGFFGSSIIDWSTASDIDALGSFELGAIDLPNDVSLRRATRGVDRALDGFHKIRVQEAEEFIEINNSVTDTVTRLILVLLSGSVALGALGMANTISLSVIERRRELAVFRSVGALGSQVQALITTEAAIMSAVGAALGVGVGTIVAVFGLRFAPAQFAADPIVPWASLGALLIAAMAIGALSAWIPARAAALRPILGDLSADE